MKELFPGTGIGENDRGSANGHGQAMLLRAGFQQQGFSKSASWKLIASVFLGGYGWAMEAPLQRKRIFELKKVAADEFSIRGKEEITSVVKHLGRLGVERGKVEPGKKMTGRVS